MITVISRELDFEAGEIKSFKEITVSDGRTKHESKTVSPSGTTSPINLGAKCFLGTALPTRHNIINV